MRTIYINSDFKCCVSDDGTMTAVETDFFDGKCQTFVEGYRYIPDGESWKREDGTVFSGEMISPWVNYDILNAHQIEYEANQKTIEELDAALLDMAYQSITEGVE